MTRRIILHQLNAVGISPAAFIRLAADNDCRHVTVFAYDGSDVLPRSNSGLTYPTPMTESNKQEVRQALAETGVTLDGIEFFPLTADVDFELYKPALARGAELGAKRAVTHIFIDDDARVLDRLSAFCELAEQEGLRVSSEFCPLTRGNPSLARAKWLVDQLGRDSFGIGVDVLHVIRSGATATDIAQLAPRYFGITQICDARGTHVSSTYIQDVHNREVPGQGDLPLHDLLSAIPAAFPIEVEVPAAHRRARGVTAAEHVRDVLTGARTIIEGLTPSR
jgi:sugar phosphate isomerase/epimerase